MPGRLLVLVVGLVALTTTRVSMPEPGSALPHPLAVRLAGGGSASVIVGVRTPHAGIEGITARPTANGIAVGRRFTSIPFFTARVNAAGLAALASMPEVASIHEDVPERVQLTDTVPLISAPAAWGEGLDGDGWTVAVLDSGVEKAHPFLVGKVTSEACFSNAGGGGGGVPLCPNGATSSTASGSGVNCDPSLPGCDHGTHVAGIIAGTNGPLPGGSTTAMSGVAPGANIASIQVYTRGDDATLCGTRGPTPCIVTFPSDQAAALDHVLTLAGPNNVNRIAAVNMSLGGGRYIDPMGCAAANPLRAAGVASLRAIGIATVVPSGNDGYLNAVSAPSCLPGVITVGSTSKNDTISTFTNLWTYPIVAPGEGVLSSVPGGLYEAKSGTSAAAAHVSAAIAILKQAQPTASVGKLFVAIGMSGKGIPHPSDPTSQSFRLDVNGALTRLRTDPSDIPGVPGRPAAVVTAGNVTLSWAAPSSGGAVTNYWIDAGTYSGGANIGSFNVGGITSVAASPGPGVYYIRVRAANNHGVSDASSETVFSIGGGAVPGSPSNLKATVNGDSLTITWNAPTFGGAPSHYVLLAGTAPGTANLGAFTAGASTTFTATPPPGTYYIRVAAVNASGTSLSSSETWFTIGASGAPGQPGTPVASVSGNSVNLTWDAPTAGGAVTSYALLVGSSSGMRDIGEFPMGLQQTITASAPPGTYYVRVVARNGAGQSPPSGESVFSIGGPGTGNINGAWNGQTSSGVSVAVVVSGGAIRQILAGGGSTCTRYTNDRDLVVPITGGSFARTVPVASTNDGYSISGTFAGGTLSGTISYSTNGCGTTADNWVATHAGVEKPILPLPPTALIADPGPSQANLTWSPPGVNPPSTIAGPTLSYDLEVGTMAGGSDVGVFAATETGYTVTNLATGSYFARVRARNASGTSQPSSEVNFAVSASAPNYDGAWTGTTSQGKAIAFTVNGGLVTSLTFGFTINATGGCTYENTASATPNRPVSGNQFNWSVLSGDPTYAINGAFTSTSAASGRIYVTNDLANNCVGSAFFSWTAAR